MSNALFRSTTRIECCDAVIRVFDEAGNVLKTHEDAGDFKEWCPRFDPVERACDFAVSSLKLPDIEPTHTNQYKVDSQLVRAATIRVHNANTNTVAGNVTLIW